MSLDPARPRDAIVAAGRERLLRHGIDALRSQLNASVLSQEVPVSRDTAYRVFRTDDAPGSVSDAIVVAVADAATDRMWGGYDVALGAFVEAYLTSLAQGNDPATNWKAALRAVFDAQFWSPGQPIGWMLQAAAITCSEAWRGEPPPDEDLPVGRALIGYRRAFYDTVGEQLVAFMTSALSDLGRRIRDGWSPQTIVAVIHAQLDGAVLRRMIDPEAMTADLFAESMYLLMMAFSEPGSTEDPRKPDDERGQLVFERLLEAAAALWEAEPEITVVAVADRAGVTAEAAKLMFPTVGDLADSLVRAGVVGGGLPDLDPVLDETTARQHLAALVFMLLRLRDFADAFPHALAASQAHPPSRSKPFLDDVVDNASQIVDALGVTDQSGQLVADLFAFAARGTAGWPSVSALLRTIDYDAD